MTRTFRLMIGLMWLAALSARSDPGTVQLPATSGVTLHELREDVSPEDLGVYTAYEEARRLEAEIVQIYREIRAAELTRVQRQTLRRSLESTLMPLSNRAEVDQEILTQKAGDARAVREYQEELAVVMQETHAIVSNAQSLLESLLNESESTTASRKREEPETGEEEEAETEKQFREEQEQAEKKESLSREEREARGKVRKAERERKEKEATEELEKTETHLEEALKEIRAARQEIAREKNETRSSLENEKSTQDSEASEAKAKAAWEKLEKLEAVEAKVDQAEEAVKSVAEKVEAMKDVSEVEVQEAEEAVEAMREAMKSVQEADRAAAKEAGAGTQKNTAEAVRQMEAARSSLDAAAEAIRSLKSDSDGEGGEGDGNIARIRAMAELAEAGSGKWLDLTDQMRGESLDRKPDETPLEERPDLWTSVEELEAAPTARKFSPATPKEQWIFIGDWYVLSRYDNEERANIEKVYPPESVLDLNAVYLSEDGQRVDWEYESYLPPMVAPYGWESWKIYYFYTELYFEEETEAWIAVGSDDRSDLWINDLPVWHSANRHKGWYPAEGFRKVVFGKGRNDVLLRLENGQQGLGFSLFLNLPGDTE